MTPRLVAISGPLEGSTFPLGDGCLSIGRNNTNEIWIQDRSVSRQHCTISPAGDGFELRDLGSHNLTYVNNLPVDTHCLQNGDEIRIGQSTFLFLTEEGAGQRSIDILDRRDFDLANNSTVVLRAEDAVYLNPQKTANLPAAAAQAADSLRCLLEIAGIVSSERKLGSFAERLLEAIGQAIPAQTAALLLVQPESQDPYLQFRWSKAGADAHCDRVPQSLVERVLDERVSILSNDVPGEGKFAESVIALRMRAILAVPMVIRDRALGLIFAATRDRFSGFNEHHLQLLTGIAGVAAGSLETVLHVETLQNENRQLQARINAENSLVGESPAIRAVQTFIAKVAPSNSTVLITGESGTGKELVARAVHRNSPRAEKPFVAINCAALTETLLESELFGHEKGAFTGAIAQKKGRLEEANGGTVFLDEVGELAAGLQAKLLRALQEREFERVGGTKPVKVDIRLIAATNRDLGEMARSGSFRQDLYYRLNVVSIAMPALRDRREDIPLLARYFVEKHLKIAGRRVLGIGREALECLTRYDWPGNVRELENVIERAMVLGSTENILADDLPESLMETAAPLAEAREGGFHEMVNEAKRRIVLAALDQAGGNYTEAAKQLGIHANNLHRLIRNLQLKAAVRR